MIDFKFWLKIPWPSIVHDGGHSAQISRNLGHILSILNFFGLNTDFSARRVASLGARLWLGAPLGEKFVFLDFSWKFMYSYPLPRDLDKFWASRRVKNTLKMTFLPLFGHTGRSVGKTHFWRGTWQPNLEIQLGLEIWQEELSNELSYAQF